MKLIQSIILITFLFIANIAFADDALVTIRFNQNFVNYKPILESAIDAALKKKSDIEFTVVTSAPENVSKSEASSKAENIIESMKEYGAKNIKAEYQPSDSDAFITTRIYVN